VLESTCPGAGCIDGPIIDGLCLEHYIEPLLPQVAAFRPHTYVPVIVRFLGYSDRSGGPNACWLYTNSIHPKSGHANIYVKDGKPPQRKAHRWAYEFFIGPIPEGREVGHTCCPKDCPTSGGSDPHNRCVNPRHLRLNPEPVVYAYDCARCGKSFTRDYVITSGWPFCSMRCRSGGRTITKTCPVCGRDFTIARSNEDRYQTCGWACQNVNTVYVDCERCGKRLPDYTREGWHRRFCSEECRRPPLMMACHNCGKEFRTHASDVKRRFCSVSCVRQFMGETQLEASVRVALELLGVGFAQEYPFLRWSIDFAVPKHKLAIEADGDFWHKVRAVKDAKRDARMRAEGWTIVRLAECDVKAARNVGQLILARVREASGLELADLLGPAQRGTREGRPKFKQFGRAARRPTRGQMPLWS